MERCKIGILNDRNQDRLRRRDLLPLVVPTSAGSEEFFADAGSDSWVLEPPDQFDVTAVVRQDGMKAEISSVLPSTNDNQTSGR